MSWLFWTPWAVGGAVITYQMERVGNSLQIVGHPTAVHIKAAPSIRSQVLAEYELHRFELMNLAAPLRLLESLIDQPMDLDQRCIVSALWCGVVLGYCRCFDGNAKAPNQLRVNEIHPDNPKAVEGHQLFWTLRQMHFAHDLNDGRQVAVGIALDSELRVVDVLRMPSEGNFGREHLALFRNLAASALDYVSARIQELEDAVKAAAEKLSAEERQALPAVEFKAPHRSGKPRRGGGVRA